MKNIILTIVDLYLFIFLKNCNLFDYLKISIDNNNKLIKSLNALVAQLDRALGYGPGGSGFKS